MNADLHWCHMRTGAIYGAQGSSGSVLQYLAASYGTVR